jgi:hypothetical protein
VVFGRQRAQNLTVDIAVPAGFTGPMTVTLNSKANQEVLDTDVLTLSQAVPFVPAQLFVLHLSFLHWDPGACSAILNLRQQQQEIV